MKNRSKSLEICDLLIHCCSSIKELQNNFRSVEQWAAVLNKCCSESQLEVVGGNISAGNINHALARHPSIKHIVNNLSESNSHGIYIALHNKQHYIYAPSNPSVLPPQKSDWRNFIIENLSS